VAAIYGKTVARAGEVGAAVFDEEPLGVGIEEIQLRGRKRSP
jgi:hypothetical protein